MHFKVAVKVVRVRCCHVMTGSSSVGACDAKVVCLDAAARDAVLTELVQIRKTDK
jgi:hypothetical protein